MTLTSAANRFCQTCGNTRGELSRFCDGCGTPDGDRHGGPRAVWNTGLARAGGCIAGIVLGFIEVAGLILWIVLFAILASTVDNCLNQAHANANASTVCGVTNSGNTGNTGNTGNIRNTGGIIAPSEDWEQGRSRPSRRGQHVADTCIVGRPLGQYPCIRGCRAPNI